MDFPTIAKTAVDFGVSGMLFALLIYLFWKYIPGLQADFKEAIETAMRQNQKQADEFRDALKEQQRLFLEALGAERQAGQGLERSIDHLTGALIRVQAGNSR